MTGSNVTAEQLVSEATAQVGVTGLAVMGANLARNFARNGYRVALHNRTASRTDGLVAQHGDEGTFIPSETLEDFVASLEKPRKVVIMVQAGAGTDAVVEALGELLEPDDILVDGGNAHFQDTIRRQRALGEKGVHFVGMGVSGGEEGALLGPSIMPGGSDHSYAEFGPMLETIAAQVDGTPCCAHVGTDGAGHFVKMVHNGIEYADMQLIAEAYDLLRQGMELTPAQLADVFDEWNRGDLESFLIETTATVLRREDPSTGQPFVDVVVDEAEQKGTGRWTVQVALELGSPVTGIAEAVFARVLSSERELRLQASKALPGPSGRLPEQDSEGFVDDVRSALHASKVVAYAQGFAMIASGGREYGWDIDLAAMATIWRGGCIIRARFLDRVREVYVGDAPDDLLLDPGLRQALDDAQDAWRRVVASAARIGVPVPGFASALAYYDGLRRERTPAALVQGLRDFFGAHTYHRTDSDGSFHVRWSEGGDEVEM